jgi:outer membrane receptor for ferrienterochelin and colicins
MVICKTMKIRFFITIFLFTLLSVPLTAQSRKTDANIFGHVVSRGEHVPFATISLKGTTIGVATDESGHYRIVNLPEGQYRVVAQFVGYKPDEKVIELRSGVSVEVNFELEPDMLGISEVVITADRNERNRTEASTIVNTITPRMFTFTQSVTLNEGLVFSPGLRIENNCSNCGFNQVRMNGLEGPYSQILINSRPVFSGLAGVYGMELIPANMIERVEVVRGGGSALYGSNAIAGTINIILKDPINNSFEINTTGGVTGLGVKGRGLLSNDYNIGFNSSVVTADSKSGLSIFGFNRNRDPFDANNDGFSEIAHINNTTVGARAFHRFGQRSKVAIDFFNIREERRGGNGFDLLYHQADITEALRHNISNAAISYDKFFRDYDLLSVYFSLQDVGRDSYYGAGQSLKDYGRTDGLTWVGGAQYNLNAGTTAVISGVELRRETLTDKKLGYPDYANALIVGDSIISVPQTDNTIIACQTFTTAGFFTQVEQEFGRLTLSAGARLDMYEVYCNLTGETDNGTVLSPRINILYNVLDYLQARVSYSQGYRAPQVFDEDLHTSTSGSRKVIIRNDPDLKREKSHSFMASLDFNRSLGGINVGFLAEGFLTRLQDPFANEYGVPDAEGVVLFTRKNGSDGAVVKGVNLELNIIPVAGVTVSTGYTIQSSRFDTPVEFGERRFFRTPDNYGFATINWQPAGRFQASVTGAYTGTMLIPYFGLLATDPAEGMLIESKSFIDLGFNLRYDIRLNGTRAQLFGGMKNLFNSYQSDFDSGVDRDPGYVYGPMAPRSVYLGIRMGIFN